MALLFGTLFGGYCGYSSGVDFLKISISKSKASQYAPLLEHIEPIL
jgi:hypothetical protein